MKKAKCEINKMTTVHSQCCLSLQLSLVIQSLRNPDVFCFADYPCHLVVIDILKTAPDDEKPDIKTW